MAQEQRTVVAFASAVPTSQAFQRLFREAMLLVEEAARYLDGEGREEAKKLSGKVRIAYANEGMRLTTRLMGAAAWVLLLRAMREGDMTPQHFHRERRKTFVHQPRERRESVSDQLPTKLLVLIERSIALVREMRHLDRIMQGYSAPAPLPGSIDDLNGRLRDAFES